MNTTIGFATIGTSKITRKFLSAAKECEGFKLVAVYSRDIKKAEQFAGEQGAERFYDSLDMLVADKDVEAVYVASPNYMHYKHVMKLLKAGKHVFCEKAIASNYAEAEEMFRTAQERHLVLLEAVRPVFDPGMQAIKNNLYKLGAIRKANISYCQYSSRYDSFKEGQEHNIFSRECSAGALMDIGVYCVHTLLYLLGMPEKISGFAVMLRSGVDGAGDILAKYQDKIAEVSYSKITDSSLPNEIQGENGYMTIEGLNAPARVTITYRDGRTEELPLEEIPFKKDLSYEVQAFIDMIQKEDHSEASFNERTRISLETMDAARVQMQMHFPNDDLC